MRYRIVFAPDLFDECLCPDFEEFLNDELEQSGLVGYKFTITSLNSGYVDTPNDEWPFELLDLFDKVKSTYKYPFMTTARLNQHRVDGGWTKAEMPAYYNWTTPVIAIDDLDSTPNKEQTTVETEMKSGVMSTVTRLLAKVGAMVTFKKRGNK